LIQSRPDVAATVRVIQSAPPGGAMEAIFFGLNCWGPHPQWPKNRVGYWRLVPASIVFFGSSSTLGVEWGARLFGNELSCGSFNTPPVMTTEIFDAFPFFPPEKKNQKNNAFSFGWTPWLDVYFYYKPPTGMPS